MPDLDCPHLLSYVFEMGPANHGDPISHSDIYHWQQNTGIELDSWQSRIIRMLSLEYLVQCQKSRSRECPPPYDPEELTDMQKEAVSNKIKESMRAKFRKG